MYDVILVGRIYNFKNTFLHLCKIRGEKKFENHPRKLTDSQQVRKLRFWTVSTTDWCWDVEMEIEEILIIFMVSMFIFVYQTKHTL